MGIMKNEEIINWILKQPQTYPGQHNQIHPKIFKSLRQTQQNSQKITLKQQFIEILKAFGNFLFQTIRQQKCIINIAQFGTFFVYIRNQDTFDKQNQHFQTKKSKINKTKNSQRSLSPFILIKFQPTSFLSRSLHSNYADEKLKNLNQNKQYQKSKRTQWMDCSVIGSRLLLPKQVISCHLKVLNKALANLAELNKSVQLDLKILKLKIQNRKMTQANNIALIRQIQTVQQEKIQNKYKKTIEQRQNMDIWKDNYQKIWKKSLMSGIRNQTNLNQIKQHFDNGYKLKIKQMFFR